MWQIQVQATRTSLIISNLLLKLQVYLIQILQHYKKLLTCLTALKAQA